MVKTEQKINFKKVVTNIFENEIKKYKSFYKEYLLKVKAQRLQILAELSPLTVKFQAYKDRSLIIGDAKYHGLETEIEELLKKYWGTQLLNIYNKEVPYEKPKLKLTKDEGFWIGLISAIAVGSQEQQLKNKAHVNYKITFLNFLKDCLTNQGLYHLIYQRDTRIYKRFNFIVTYKENREEYYVARILMSHSELETEFLSRFFKKRELIVNGRIIKYSNIKKVNITTTLLLDDEIELFAAAEGFTWNSSRTEASKFAVRCVDETNTYLKDPNSLAQKRVFKNNKLTFIEQGRIDELASIKTRWDLSRLISLCNELNQSSTIGSVVAVASLQRTIINHVPPIFGFKEFGQVVANYNTGKSIKKSLANLSNSMRTISNNHAHSLISTSDSLPNMTQVDFSNDLDVLLCEVCKILKGESSAKK